MYELDEEQFTRYVVRQIETLNKNVTLSNPDNTEEFPLYVVSNVMSSIRRAEDGTPIFSRFSVSIESWANSKYESMRLSQDIKVLLRASNFAPIGAPIDRYDEITKKHRYGYRYEVNYNGLNNSFERVI